ncbi:Cystathionine gamma-lyase [Porphyridium purpureum]|uniref:cystathionine gamma-lyase n=1 Tax=Porphyridium purpureum TaxID=35688 RepID=A0A5J4YQW9_PORPP|nr:Cystathionine gamma-lyase [Porphyridium purpureum]|eukprot:POR6543..scf236_6
MKFETRALHVGQAPDANGAVVPGIELSTTFAQRSPGHPLGAYDYSRSGNPTRERLEQCVASLEGGKHGLAFASGLAATVTLMHTLKPGDHVVCIDDVYGGTQRYFRRVAKGMGIRFSFVDFGAHAEHLESAMEPETKMIWLETPTNPTMKVVDITQTARIARGHTGVVLVVDNTFMSPFCQRPLELGADVSFNSVSKYINGHSDVIMGMLCLSDDTLHSKLRFLQNSLGAVPSPFDCYLALRGAKTLAVRMRQHETNARQVAAYLEAHPHVRQVLYPGLESHAQRDVAARQNYCAGGMLSFVLDGGLLESKRFLEHCSIMTLAESLGGVESLIEHPALMTHASVSPDVRERLGISDSLIRLSVGLEHIDDLLAELAAALDAAFSKTKCPDPVS